MLSLSAEIRDFFALCVLASLGLVLVGGIVLKLRRSPFSPAQSLLYALNYVVVRVLWRVHISGSLAIPPRQGAVIICNHRCPLDPSFIALTVLRVVHWMVAKEYCEDPALRWLLRTCGAIPVSRAGIDTAATRKAIRLAQNGGLVAMFPEGRINTTEEMLLPSRPGAAMIALKARVPVVPCYIHGSPYNGTTLGCLLMPASVKLIIGRPIDLTPYYDRDGEREVLEELTRLFLREVAALGGRPDFQPQLAGRFYKPVDKKNS
jgi:1-acyl-sn-glycerol-3-phosphate acyltransferase